MRIFLPFILSLFVSIGASALPSVHTGAAPTWLYTFHPDLGRTPAQHDISDGYYYSLLEEQTSLLTNTSYNHYIRNIINESGVQNASEVSVTFSPQFQNVVFHHIRILREGSVLNRLRPDEIKVVQEETEAGEFQYNGLKRAYLTLKDVRKGDQIEVSYSIIGFNPVFANKYSDDIFFTNGTAVCNYYKAVITTPARRLNIVRRNNALAPVEKQQGSTLVYFWENPPLKSDESSSESPVWYNDIPTVYLSEYTDWHEVVNWGLTTFDHYNYSLPAGLSKKIAAWRLLAKGDKDRFANLAARFVQNEVRYLGLEIGANTHRPHPPSEVFDQRFGDCKDKALLLTVILRQEGIPAYVALVNTSLRSQLTNTAPSPGVFNHAITVIQRPKDSLLYIDPTVPSQRGELSDLYVPAYGYSLILRDGENRLEPVTPGRINDYTVIETIDARYYDTSFYTINTLYTGGCADDIRQTFAENSMKEMEERYHNYYSSSYEHIRQTGPITISDDSIKNEFKVNKEYAIPQLWKTNEKGKKYFNFTVRLIGQSLHDPSDITGEEPVSLPYPMTVHYTAVFNLPERWGFSSGPIHIKNDAYEFDFKPEILGNNLTLYYTLTTFKDHIPASALPAYRSDYKLMESLLYFDLYRDPSDGNEEDWGSQQAPKNMTEVLNRRFGDAKACWPAIWLTFFFALFFSRLFAWLNRREEDTVYSHGTGYPLGGWLILLGIGLIAGLGIALYEFIDAGYYSYSSWKSYSKAGTSLQFLYLSQMAVQLSFIAGGGASVFWFFKRRDIFPRMFVWYAGILLSGHLLLILLFHLLPVPPALNSYKQGLIVSFIRTCVYSAIWVSYVLRSDQVKSTFLEPFRSRS